MFVSTGFGSTVSNTTAATAPASRRERTRSAMPAFTTPGSQTTKARLAPIRLICVATVDTAPAPKTTVVGKAQVTSGGVIYGDLARVLRLGAAWGARGGLTLPSNQISTSDRLEVARELPIRDSALVLPALPVTSA